MEQLTVLLYAVSSSRKYQDDESYFGTDGVYATEEEAKAYIEEDVADTIESDFGDDEYEREDDGNRIELSSADKVFVWQIEPIYVPREIIFRSLGGDGKKPARVKVIIRNGVAEEKALTDSVQNICVEIVDIDRDYEDREKLEKYANKLYDDPTLREVDLSMAHFYNTAG